MISFIGVIFKRYIFSAKDPSLVPRLDQPEHDPTGDLFKGIVQHRTKIGFIITKKGRLENIQAAVKSYIVICFIFL